MKILKLLLAIIVVMIASYCLITGAFAIFPLALIFLGMMFLVSGYEEFQKNQKVLGSFLFLVAAFQFIVVIYTLI